MPVWRGVFAAFFALAALAPASRADDLERLGDILQVATPVYGLYESYRLNGREGFWRCAKAGVIAGGSTAILKRGLDARRPNGGDRGFPSGHTCAAALGFGCSLGQAGWSTTTWVLGAATLVTGYSRVESGYHSWDQVGAAMVLGTAIGYFSTVQLRERAQMQYDVTGDGRHILKLNVDF